MKLYSIASVNYNNAMKYETPSIASVNYNNAMKYETPSIASVNYTRYRELCS